MPSAVVSVAPPNQHLLFEAPDHPKVQQALAQLATLDQNALKSRLNNNFTQVSSYSGHVAASLKVPGFSDNSADASSQCLIYEQTHFMTTETMDDGYTYNLGWSQRLVIKVTKMEASLSLTVPSAVAVSCQTGHTTASVQYVVIGLTSHENTEDLAGTLGSFNVDQLADYSAKMRGLLRDLDSGKVQVSPAVIARTLVPTPVEPAGSQADVTAASRAAAYRMCAVNGILGNATADVLYTEMTTKGKNAKHQHQPIADPPLLRKCIDQAYADYGIGVGQRLSDVVGRSPIDTLTSRIRLDVDAFVVARKAV